MLAITTAKIVKQNIIVRVEGKRFFCKCGCNVFHEYEDGSIGCNACETVYKECE
jgi:hypothetical protein